MKSMYKFFFAAAACLGLSGPALAAPLALTGLTGMTGTPPADLTGVWRADLMSSGLPFITQIIITDTSGGVGGASSEYSGTDLDAVRIATSSVGDATMVPAASVAIDFGAAVFMEGTQRPPGAPLLFGTSAANTLNNVVATLAAFDADSISPFNGFLSMGDGGKLVINLAAPINPAVDRYLYIGEAGNNGETFSVEVVPEPSTLVLAGLAGLAIVYVRRRRG